MESSQREDVRYPAALVNWAGHHSGGVKRLFAENSGLPNNQLLETNLLSRLQDWTLKLSSGAPNTPRIVLLVGGPGNGKTEAIESTIRWLDENMGCNGLLIDKLARSFLPSDGSAVPRLVKVDAGNLASADRNLSLHIVQDASSNAGHGGRSPSTLLVEELNDLLDREQSHAYLCCVNRGVLDDALIYALDNSLDKTRNILEAITQAVSLSHDAPSCWPLKGFPTVAVWPMDAESLLLDTDEGLPAPAKTLIEQALQPELWPSKGTCVAGAQCPFCSSQATLSRTEQKNHLLKILRWFELTSGKRWSFRDLFSLVSYLLAGHHSTEHSREDISQQFTPCQWAAKLIELDQKASSITRPNKQMLTAIYRLATSSYQHALFHSWNPDTARSIRKDLKSLGFSSVPTTQVDRTLKGLAQFLEGHKKSHLPATIAPLLETLAETLDPAFASPTSKVAVSGQSKVTLGDLDIHFSRSLAGGVDYIRKYQVLSKNEMELLKRLAAADTKLSEPIIRRKKPTAATRLQHVLRDFACRLVRRSICTRTAAVADADVIQAFQKVIEDDNQHEHLYEVVKQVKKLLNPSNEFEVSLTTTFGQPLPPRQRGASLVTQQSPVRVYSHDTPGRPRSPICYLSVGQGQSAQPVPLTYDLFKAVKELQKGLSPASLPRTVLALLDTTKARLSGPVVRNQDLLEDAKIRIGADGTIVARTWNGGFVASTEVDE